MPINYILPARGIQASLSLTVLSLTSYISHWWSIHWRQTSPVEVNFLLFAASWTLIVLGCLTVVPLKFSHAVDASMRARYGLLVLEGLTTLYWFGGFVALAVFLRDRICFGAVCHVARASAAIGAVNWLVWTATFVFGVVREVRGVGEDE